MNGSIPLDCGTYIIDYSFGATAPLAGRTVTITPEYGGTLHPEYARSFTITSEDQTFEISDTFSVNLQSDSTLTLNVTIDGDTATETTTLTGVNSSMYIRRVQCNG